MAATEAVALAIHMLQGKKDMKMADTGTAVADVADDIVVVTVEVDTVVIFHPPLSGPQRGNDNLCQTDVSDWKPI
jgi:hypothetical protein